MERPISPFRNNQGSCACIQFRCELANVRPDRQLLRFAPDFQRPGTSNRSHPGVVSSRDRSFVREVPSSRSIRIPHLSRNLWSESRNILILKENFGGERGIHTGFRRCCFSESFSNYPNIRTSRNTSHENANSDHYHGFLFIMTRLVAYRLYARLRIRRARSL